MKDNLGIIELMMLKKTLIIHKNKTNMNENINYFFIRDNKTIK